MEGKVINKQHFISEETSERILHPIIHAASVVQVNGKQ
jgi:hypothetical protein